MSRKRLPTVCTCIVRSILDAVFGRRVEGADFGRASAARAERMMRNFRDGVLANSSTGKVIADAIAETAPDVTRVLALDPISYGLAVDLLEPWAKASTSLSVLKKTIDEQTVLTATELIERVTGLAPETKARLRPLLDALRKSEGAPVRKLVGSYRPPAIPPVERARKRPSSQKRRRT